LSLYGRRNDISLFRSINREIIHDIIDIKVDLYKIILDETEDNLYGESLNKKYYTPIRLHCLISTEDQDTDSTDFGPDKTQVIRVAFLKDDIIKYECPIDIGDIFNWNDKFWEIDAEISNQLFLKRDPVTNKLIEFIDNSGWSVSIIFAAHEARREKLQIEEARYGNI